MRFRTIVGHLGYIGLLLTVVFTRDVHAYLDPGTGSMVFQTVVAALAAAGYGLRVYWSRIRALFGRTPDGERAETDRLR